MGHRPFLVSMAVVVALAAAACGEGNTAGGGNNGGNADLSGAVVVDGSSTVFPVTEAVAEEFQLENPDVQVTVGQSGTGGGFEKFCNGETDISNASRPIKPEEQEACTANGIEPIEMQIAIDGLTVAVNPQNDFVDCLTVDQLQAMYEPGSTVRTWQDVDPSWPAEAITFYAPGSDSGTFDYFTEEVVGESAAMRSDPAIQTSEDDNILVQGIAADRYATGFFGYAYYQQNTETLTAVAIDGGSGCVAPTDETIESGEYTPLSRPIFIYPATQSIAEKPQVEAFVDFYLENVSALVADVGYIPVPEARLEEARTALENAAA